MSREIPARACVPPPLPSPRHVTDGPCEDRLGQPSVARRKTDSWTSAMIGSSIDQQSHSSVRSRIDGGNYGNERPSTVGQKRRASSPAGDDGTPSLNTVGIASDLFRRRDCISRRSATPGIYSGHAGSNNSTVSILSYSSHGSNDSYTSSVRSARGITDANSDSKIGSSERHRISISNITDLHRLSLGGQSSSHFIEEMQDIRHGNARSSEQHHQTWEMFCDLHLVAFLQMCTLEDVHTLTRSPTLLQDKFKRYLKRMISQEGNIDFLSYKAVPPLDQPEAQLQLLRHHKSIFSQSRSSIRSYSSHTSNSSTSTTNSFSSQISDGTMLNHVQQEAKSLKDCMIKIQKKLTFLVKSQEGAQSKKDQEGSAAELASLRTLLGTNENSIKLLNSKEGDLALLGFSDMSLHFAKFHREFAAIYKDLTSLKRQSRFQRVFRPGRSKQEIDDRDAKYRQIERAERRMTNETFTALETAEAQKDAFMAVGRPYASFSILESATELNYAPYEKYAGSSLVTRKFLKIGDPRLQKTRNFMCECCPNQPNTFETADELSTHEMEKHFECAYCRARFKNRDECERHQSSGHFPRHSWSCVALPGYAAAFQNSAIQPNKADTCGYCGEDFPRSGISSPPNNDSQIAIATEPDWETRIAHLQEMHKFGQCNHSKKFFRVDHFRQHLKYSHAGTIGKWTRMLETLCMQTEHVAEHSS